MGELGTQLAAKQANVTALRKEKEKQTVTGIGT